MNRLAPHPPFSSFLGHLDKRGDGYLEFLLQTHREYGDIFRLRFVNRWVHIVGSPELAKQILMDQPQVFARGFVQEKLKVLLGDGILTSEGDGWRKQRRLMQPAFHQQSIRSFFDGMVRNTQELLRDWESSAASGQPRNVSDDFMKLTLRIVSEALFGFDTTGSADQISGAVELILPEIYRKLSALPLQNKLPTPANIQFWRRNRLLDRVIYRIIEQRRKDPADKHHDLLAMLMHAVDEEGGPRMSDTQLRDEVMTMFMAGHETTANALSWTVYLLMQNPEVEKKVRDEVQKVFAAGPFGLDRISSLSYTRSVIEESMRLYPPIWMISRDSAQNGELGGYFIPKGCGASASPWVIHRNPRVWKDPEVFNPDRFSEQNRKSIPKYAYIPFGAGQHTCIGNQFAMMEAQVILAMIYYRVSLAPVDIESVRPEATITLRPAPRVRAVIKQV